MDNRPTDRAGADENERDRQFQIWQSNWNQMYAQVLLSDRLAGDIGIFCLKAVIAVNGGALVALLAFYPLMEQASNIQAAIPKAMYWFVGGLVASLVSAGFAYFYQSAVTASWQSRLDNAFGNTDSPSFSRAHRWKARLKYPMVLLATIGAGAFVVGLTYMAFALAAADANVFHVSGAS